MTRITIDLLRRRAEHNEKNLRTLEEITLHQFDIEKIELIGSVCKNLKILFFQNNLISKIENLHRMKSLEYLNLALNNITLIENLHRCESLKKLDLTVNFIDIDNLERSIFNLQKSQFLGELFLTGNPCQSFADYRAFVISQLPQLKRLDAEEITLEERLNAEEKKEEILEKLRIEASIKRKEKMEKEKEIEELKKQGTFKIDENQHTPEARFQTYLNEQEQEKNDKLEKEAQAKFGKPKDQLKEVRKKLGEWAEEGEDGKLPSQRNQHRLEFKMEEDDGEGNIIYLIQCPKFIDTNLLDVRIHPLWFQAVIKGKSILLHLPAEVICHKCRVRRVLSTGWLELLLPRCNPLPRIRKKKCAKPITKGEKDETSDKKTEENPFLELDQEWLDDEDVPPLM